MKTDSTSALKKLLLLFLVVSGLYFAKEFLMPIAIGGVIATLFMPFCRWMEVNRLPKALAVFVCLLIIVIIATAIGFLFGWQISALANDYALIEQKVFEKRIPAQNYIFRNLGITVEKQTEILKTEQPSVTNIVQVLLESIRHFIVNFVFIFSYIFLLLYYRSHIKQFLIKLSPLAKRKETEQLIYSVANVSQQYLLGLAKIIFCLWIMYGIGFGIIGVNNFILFAILCGLLEIIPFIGNITGTILTVLVAAMHGSGLPVLGGIIAVYGIVQFIQGWILEPLILGPQVKINPLFTIIALVLGNIIWGVPGIILAIPITAMLKIICDNVESLKPYGFLIGEIETVKPKQSMTEKIKRWFKK